MKKFSFHLFKNLPAREKKITVSTMLTLIRLALIPFIVIAMIQDVLCTFLGAALDPITDKLLVIAIFFTLAFIQPFLFRIPLWFVIGVLLKELIQITGAIIIYSKRGYLHIAPTFLGKANGVVQTIFITWLFTCYFFNWAPFKTYYVLLTLVAAFVVLTFVDYVRIGMAQVRS